MYLKNVCENGQENIEKWHLLYTYVCGKRFFLPGAGIDNCQIRKESPSILVWWGLWISFLVSGYLLSSWRGWKSNSLTIRFGH